MKFKLLLLFIFINLFMYSQEKKYSIHGVVSIEKKPSADCFVELHYNSKIRKAITNKEGKFNFSKLDSIQNVELVFKTKEYKSIYKTISIKDFNNEIQVNFTNNEIILLDSIVLQQQQVYTKANKIIYKVNQKNFTPNSTAPSIFNYVPTLFSSGNSEEEPKVIVDGKLQATIFIDGIEAISGEVNNLPISTIEKIEVINNPSAKYGSDFTGAIVNIITKKTVEQYFKGNLNAVGYAINKNWYISPSLAYKKGILTWKSNYSYRANNNKVEYESNRTDQNGFFNQFSNNNSTGNQQNLTNNLKLDFSKKATLVIKNALFGYNFKSDALGFTNNNGNFLNYSKKGENGTKNWYNSMVFDYKITDKKVLYVKGNYNYNSDYNNNSFLYSNNIYNEFDITSNLNTYSLDIDFESEETSLFKKESSLYSDIKFIQRDFDFSNTDFYLKQQVFDYNFEFDTEWNDNFSTEIAFTIEHTRNFNSKISTTYNYFLPTINLLYHFENKTELKFGFSRKILRPSASDLNDDVNVINPGVAMQGNSNLQSEVNNYLSLNLSKTIKSNYFGLKLYTENINNNIVNVYRTDGIYLIQTLDNAAKYYAWGLNATAKTKLFKKLDINFSSGFDYSFFEDKSENAIIKSNSGISYIGSLSLNMKIIKDKISLSLSANQNAPNFSLLSKRITYPKIYFSANTTLIKDKLNASLSAGNLLGNFANGFDDISSNNTFYQKISTRNNSTNIGFGLTYYFGKKFNDAIQDKSVNYNDIR